MNKISIPLREELYKSIKKQAHIKGVSPMNLILTTLNKEFIKNDN